MSDRLRYRFGQVHLRKAPVASATVIEAGDMVFVDASTDEVMPAADFTWNTNLATTQAGFAAVFMGIAHEPSAAGETDEISIDVSPESVYEFLCASAAYQVGQPLGPDENSSTLHNQTLEAAIATSAIARAAEETGSTTKLLVTFASAFYTGSGNVNANVG